LACAAFVASVAVHFSAHAENVARVDPPPTPASDAATCATELAACRAEGWALVARTIRADVDERRAPDAPPPPRARDAAQPAVDPIGVDAQRLVLCDVAEQQAREHWAAHRADILASVRDVGKPEWATKESKKHANDLAKDLGLSPRDEDRVARAYADLWAKHGSTFQRALAADPTDWTALMDIVRAWWREEDAMIERTLGAAARSEYRVLDLRSRTTILAILAALADKPFAALAPDP
jgi:hypothetical protein